MRLKSIKLAGFKSFVDPTTVDLPSNLCAIVGPNGCGKSNIIDAVRWVMGESSAKNLRGESMIDVIFNGSGGRKPVGQASIELIFDNSDGSIGGEYANFNEVSIKRKVTRDAQNIYYLNGHKCRRRDITDIFLGTGLGPRSYAIIEQGMISRLIESKPEELRVFIEEAAGISKYKERRKETESRMKRTFENMERLTDIRDELARQLQHLHRQAQAAEKYSAFKKDERLCKAQIQAMQWQDLDKSVNDRAEDISRIELDLEAELTKQVHLDALKEKMFTQQSEVRDNFNEIQGRHYGIKAEIARTEESIRNQKDRFRTLNDDLEKTRINCNQAEVLLLEDKDKQELWQMELEEILPEFERLNETEESSQEILVASEEQMQDWQQSWDEFNSVAANSRQRAEVQQSRIQHAEKVLGRIDERVRRHQDELQSLFSGPIEEDIAGLIEQVAEIDMQKEAQQQQLEDLQESIEVKREASTVHAHRLDEINSSLQTRKGRLASLDALQQAALMESNDKVAAWLMKNGLAENSVLAEKVSVSDGWEKAIETVLSSQLQALCVDDIDGLATQISELERGSIHLITAKSVDVEEHSGLMPLASFCDADSYVDSLLAGIYVAEDLTEALANKSQLKAHESIVCRDGVWLGLNWLRRLEESDAQAGVLKRKQDIEILSEQISKEEKEKAVLQDKKKQTREQLSHAERERDDCQRHFSLCSNKLSELTALLSGCKVKVEQITDRKEQIQRDLDESQGQYKLEQENLSEARGILEGAIESMGIDSDQREALIQKRDDIRSRLDSARNSARSDKDRAHQLAMREQALRTQISNVELSLERTHAQLVQLLERRSHLELELAQHSGPNDDANIELEVLLDKSLQVEQELISARNAVDDLENDMRNSERQRNIIQQAIQKLRSELEQSRLASQTWQVQRENLQNQIIEAEFDIAQIIAALPLRPVNLNGS